jgi:hypothetical protein
MYLLSIISICSILGSRITVQQLPINPMYPGIEPKPPNWKTGNQPPQIGQWPSKLGKVFFFYWHICLWMPICDLNFILARTQVIIRKPDTVAMQWNAIVLPFCGHLWFGVGVAMVVLILCLATIHWLIRHCSNIEDENFGFGEAVFIVYSAVCQQGRYLQYRLTKKTLCGMQS